MAGSLTTLWDRFSECRSEGMPGIPRPELLAYLEQMAEQLDWMHERYQQQHLDVRPQCFLLENGRITLGFAVSSTSDPRRLAWKFLDYILIEEPLSDPGVTPAYAALETFDGMVTGRCDQYSLAIVYQELLTGIRPFSGTNIHQIVLQHIISPPNLSPLPVTDVNAIGLALSREPDDRFASCLEMVKAIRENPFRSSVCNPDWLTWNDATIPRIARKIVEQRKFEDMIVLADAFEEAGCTNTEILRHCRGPGPHVRGCWVLDALLAKE